MEARNKTYLPAAGHDWALPFYDPLSRLLGFERATRMLVHQAALQPAHRVLDIGCGTGTLAVRIKRLYPEVNVIGLDPDPKALSRARRKARQAAVSIQFDQGFSEELPYPDASFDRVFSSFMFHHLQVDRRGETLREVRRVLAPGGSLHLLDFEQPELSGGGLLTRWIRSSHHLDDNSEQRILAFMQEAGLAGPRKVATAAMLFGLLRMGYFQANAPS
ncbi:MAG TPA: class I SAM-dependent methyltransferase [Bryobacteraceae bacterium]|nr:class I SAM-dependent methyltransferase [Bryobacteraceae bacterium]